MPSKRNVRLNKREIRLRSALDALLLQYGPENLSGDPLCFPHRYKDPSDRELAALLGALFAYGNVKAMGAFLEVLFGQLGKHPARTLRLGVRATGWPGYRFQTGGDVGALLRGIGALLRRFRSLEACFDGPSGPVEVRVERFAQELRDACDSPTRGLLHLLPLPSSGSACKRWWLFLRWVCRPTDGLDLGLWSSVSPSELLLPVDTHVARIAGALGLTGRRSPDGKFAREATAALRRLCPDDPVRYDFALARPGILGECPCRPGDPVSARCPLGALCRLHRWHR